MERNGVRSRTRMYLLQLDPCVDPASLEHQAIPPQMLNLNHASPSYVMPLLHTEHTDPLPQPNTSVVLSTDSNDVYVCADDQKLYQVFANNVYQLPSGTIENTRPLVFEDQKIDITEKNKSPTVGQSCENLVNYSKTIKSEKKYYDVHISDRVVPPRAVAVLPTILQLRRDGISPRKILPARMRFGPVQGTKHEVSPVILCELVSKAATSMVPIFLQTSNSTTFCIDTSDRDKSNWFSLLTLGDKSTANVWLFEEGDALYGVTTRCIPPRTKLCLGYSKQYADRYKLHEEQPILDLNEELPEEHASITRRWWCHECKRALTTAALLHRHIDIYHKEEKRPKRRRYRCRYCSRIFSRLFTLKRHMSIHCKKKTDKTTPPAESVIPLDTDLNNSLSVEDERLPSDESFQNYTNGLDFSTNLFDTDRMSGLDISGNSRSETDLNPYSVSNKDVNELNNESELFKMSKELDIARNVKEDYNTDNASTFTCPHCDQTIASDIKRRHKRECLWRKYSCECGVKFLNKEMLTQHIQSAHKTDFKPRLISVKSENDSVDSTYKCEQCQFTFKRRGMLVNHLWRVHRAAGARVPLERRVWHYPCVACPKLYRSAAKRDTHVRLHHPGAEALRAQSIESGRRACEPAVCTACPRQYATRAKLLQHVRAHHPHLAPPLQKRPSKSASKVRIMGLTQSKSVTPSEPAQDIVSFQEVFSSMN